ncbi:MAG: hypothetical protein HUU38_19050 [Anaerolineales bacterium]|nr:hypothetical protein [Anaerolineales bacterium]
MAGGGGYYFAAYWTFDQDLRFGYISAVGVDYSVSYNIAFFSNATAVVVNETFDAFRGVDGNGVTYPTLFISTQSGSELAFGLDEITGTGSRSTLFIVPGSDRPATIQIKLRLYVDGAWPPITNNLFLIPLANPPIPR